MFVLAMVFAPVLALAAPFAAIVMDARTGEVLYETNADTRLHPASLTKMMTLYIAFQAIERGEITLDTKVKISKHAAGQAPSKLGLKPGQRIALRYLIRAAAIKSANDAATAIGEAISGSEPAFAKRMTSTAKALGMTGTTFRNANGLTASGHLSTARDMTILGRHLFYDFPQYYNIFSRRSANAGIAQVNSTNRRFLDSYQGADGIKTGYTVPAGFNLTASAQRGNKRIIATIFGGKSTVSRNAKMAELLDLGFSKAPNRATIQKPQPPAAVTDPGEMLLADADDAVDSAVAAAISQGVDADMNDSADGPAAAKTIRVKLAVDRSARPVPRPTRGTEPETMLVADATPVEPAPLVAEPEVKPATPPGPVFVQTAIPQPETLALAGTLDSAAPQDTAKADALQAALASAGVAAVDQVESASAAMDTGAAADVVNAEADAAPVEETPSTEVQQIDGIDAAVLLALEEAGDDAGPASLRPVRRPGSDEAVGETEIVTASAAAASDSEVMAAGVTVPSEAVLPEAQAPTEGLAATQDAPRAPPPTEIILAEAIGPEPAPEDANLEVVTRISTSGGRQWGISVGRFGTRSEAERVLIQTALVEMNTLDEALRKVVGRGGAYDANFVGMTQENAELACRRLVARASECTVIQPTG